MEVPVYNMQGESVGSMSIDESILGGSLNPRLIKQAYVCYHANLRQGSARTKGRGQVEGSTRKIYKQKGTGRARHGDRKAPQFRKGGHAHEKRRTREDYRLSMPKKMRRKANLNALLAKLVDGEVKVVDRIQVASPSTRAMASMLRALGIDRRVLVALPQESVNERLSARNIDDVTLCRSDQLTAWNLLNNRYVVIEKAQLEAYLAGPHTQVGKDAKLEPRGRRAAEASEGEAA
ncbi:MAG: 50S ribosomal protein L4 [Phycisphaerales bacterium]|nr:MAG: 50S ribosomal protein L4 [Phycisphaerales bacterium]